MSITQIFGFDSPSDFNRVNTEVTGGKAKLALVANPGQTFAQAFSSDTGFTYDNTKVEFVGGLMRQKDLRPANAVVGGKFATFDLNWSLGGSLVATTFGTPALVAGRLQCFGYGNSGVYWQNANIQTLVTAGAVKLRYRPNYSGSPTQNVTVFELAPASGITDKISLFHGSTGAMRLTTINNVGTTIHAAVSGTVWVPVAGTEYEIEFNFDTVTGAYRVFINGVLQSTFTATAYTRTNTASRLYVGAGTVYLSANAEYDDVVAFSTVQHTAGYVAGYTLPDLAYDGSVVNLPSFTYTGIGTILTVDTASVVEAGSPRFIIAGKWYNGAAWVNSNGTYTEANSFATALANLATFVATGATLIPITVAFTASNSLSSLDNFSVVVTGQKYSPTGHLEPVQGINVLALTSYTHTIITGVNTAVGVILKIDGVLTWYDGITWVESDGTPAESNTAAEVLGALPDLELGSNSTIFVRWVLSTSTNIDTPEIDLATVIYSFGAIDAPPTTCIVYGYLKNLAGDPVQGATVSFEMNENSSIYNEGGANVMYSGPVAVVTDVNGYFSTNLIRSSEMSPTMSYKVKITKDNISIRKVGTGKIVFEVPDAATKDITDLVA